MMAHEIAHVAACHAARENTRGSLMQMATIPLIFVGGGVGYAAYEAAGLAVPLTFMHFSRGFETEADYLGLQYMYKSGYDGSAFLSFLKRCTPRKRRTGHVGQSHFLPIPKLRIASRNHSRRSSIS